MSDSGIREFGRCACGEWAIVKLGEVPRCLACFDRDLAIVAGRIRRDGLE